QELYAAIEKEVRDHYLKDIKGDELNQDPGQAEDDLLDADVDAMLGLDL
ncbi:MAG: hypothetical protein GX849_04125, partial [Clostridiaceae bacterium]|nr:hypothetical protein [Clostridiaceae bacterium]